MGALSLLWYCSWGFLFSILTGAAAVEDMWSVYAPCRVIDRICPKERGGRVENLSHFTGKKVLQANGLCGIMFRTCTNVRQGRTNCKKNSVFTKENQNEAEI